MLRIVPFHEILEDRTALKHTNLLAVGQRVRYGGDAAIGVDFQEPGLFLLIVHHVDGADL